MTLEQPHYAVIFTSLRRRGADDGYAAMAARMEELARQQPGFLGIESARGEDGFGITTSYWTTREAILAWGQHVEHLVAQCLGRERWYDSYTLRICRVEGVREFTRSNPSEESHS